MRFIHLGDVRLGLNAESGKRWEQDRRLEIFDTLRRTVRKAEEISCELMLISGDLFSHQPVTSELEEVNRLFLSIPGTEIVIVTGRGDMIKSSSPVRSFCWAPNVHLDLSGDPSCFRFPRLSTAVYAMSVFEHSKKGTKELAGLINEDSPEELIRIGLIWEPSPEKAAEQLSDARLSYAALGGRDAHEELEEGRLCYCGGLEPRSMSDGGPHGIYIGDISSASGRLIKLEFLPMASVTYMPLAININKSTKQEELASLIASEIEKRGSRNIYRLRLYGRRDPGFEPDLHGIEETYRISEVVDETEPQYDLEGISEEHPYDLLGYYVNHLRRDKREPSELELRAMHYGIDALLRTSGSGESMK